MRHFIYALSKKKRMLVAALSCPDEKTGNRAYMMACQQTGLDLDDSVCGVIRVNAHATINVHDDDSHGTSKLKFDVDDFEFAELQTRERIHEGKIGGRYDNFMRSVEVALEELTGEIEPAMHSCSITEAKVRDIVRTELLPMIEHDIEDTISGIFDSMREKPVTITQSASNVANQIQAVININRIDSTLRKAYREDTSSAIFPIVAAIKENTVAFEKYATRLDGTFHLLERESHLSEDLPDFDKDGFFESQELFASRTGWSENTLEKHRETKSHPVWVKDGAVGKSKAGHFFRAVNDKPNSPYEYFVYYDLEKSRRFHKQ
jgi:hypothetical protein